MNVECAYHIATQLYVWTYIIYKNREGKNVTQKKEWIGPLCEEYVSDCAFAYTCATLIKSNKDYTREKHKF